MYVDQTINILCSQQFVFGNYNSKICRWIHENGSNFADTFQSSLVDCPTGYVLNDLSDLGNVSGGIDKSIQLLECQE